MTVNQGQIKAMGDIMAKLNAAMGDTPPPPRQSSGSPVTASTAEPGSDAAKKAAMGEIMARFRQATHNIRETAQTNEVLMEALTTERTDTGVRIAEWEIVIKEHENRAGKFYDVKNTATDSVIARDLRLYEAALLLSQELNRGQSITSPSVRKLLTLEEQFSKNLEDAARYARIAKASSGDKQMIAEARYSDARSKAQAAKEAIQRIR